MQTILFVFSHAKRKKTHALE